MSFDDYVNHITRKYRFAIAIAIIKNTHDNKTTETYINELKKKVIDEKMDSDDLEITVCSDDFDIGDENCINNDMIKDNNGNNDINDVMVNDTQVTNDSITILNDFEDFNDRREPNRDDAKINEISDVFRMLTGVDENYLAEQTQNQKQSDSQITYCDVDSIDNDATFCKTIDTINQINNIKPRNNLDRPNYVDTAMNLGEDLGADLVSINNIHKAIKCNTTIDLQSENVTKDISSDKNPAEVNSNVKPPKNLDLDKKLSRKVKEIDTVDSQETIIYTLYGLTENYTHVSQSQNENLIITDKYIHGVNKIWNENAENIKLDKQYNIESKEPNINHNSSSQNDLFTQHAQRFDDSQNIRQELTKSNDCPKLDNVLQSEHVIEDDISDFQVELIPFKVIEELSKVKGFLNRKNDRRISTDGFLTDSGYKSDSQVRSSGKSALQLSGTWVNQSAHSLFNFITICPLRVNTREITNEISRVLGQLIDKLHEEEKYPTFLEELLESVDLLLRRIYEDDGDPENELQNKDETIQRLLLLNQSINIQKYCLEKITNILDEAHTNLINNDEQFEILQIKKIENLSYIFHVLEIILKKYVKGKDLSSQGSSKSQEDDRLRRSSITDIWRKKWNPNYKEICVNESNLDKKCVLVKCSEVLNKLIVNCMECYSLVAYAALQCFNLLQS